MLRKAVGIVATGVIALAIGTAGSMVIGSAESAAVTSNGVGSDAETIARCTTAALTVVPNLTTTTVSSVTVGSLPAACGGATLLVAVNNGTTSSTGSATVPGAGGSVTVTIAVPPTLTSAMQTDLVLVGP